MALAVSTQLNVLERKSLRKCEARIKEGMATFVDVGNALAEIRDGKLYREGHKTFDAYCKEKWEMTPQYAKRLVNASKTTEALKSETIVSVLPANEAQAKELSGLQPETAAEVMETVAAEGPVTAAKIRETVTKATGAKPPKAEKSNGKPPKQYPRSHWYKQWDNAIGPIVRLVDKIANEVGERHDPHQEAIQDFLDKATAEMMEWMGVEA